VNRGDRTISRIDPQRGTVVATIELENEPVRVAAGDGAVWVTVQEAETP
jgi:DNA-binding beta-propeller fold protein YncE